MKTISLGQGYEALVSDADHGPLSKFSWHVQKKPDGRRYATHTIYVPIPGLEEAPGTRGRKVDIMMHRLLLNCPEGLWVDHMNGNGLDNQRENIRIATSSENSRSFQRKSARASSQYRGVSHKQSGKWEASISLGQFDSEAEAALAFDRAASLLFGGLVQLNFPVK